MPYTITFDDKLLTRWAAYCSTSPDFARVVRQNPTITPNDYLGNFVDETIGRLIQSNERNIAIQAAIRLLPELELVATNKKVI